MPEIIIYTSNLCPYCTMAKRLLAAKGAVYTELNVDTTPGLREEMVQKLGGELCRKFILVSSILVVLMNYVP